MNGKRVTSQASASGAIRSEVKEKSRQLALVLEPFSSASAMCPTISTPIIPR